MVDILALVLRHDDQAVLAAVELALAEGVATKTHVLNFLHRPVDGKTATGPDIDPPKALALRREPRADVGRYDALRAHTAGSLSPSVSAPPVTASASTTKRPAVEHAPTPHGRPRAFGVVAQGMSPVLERAA